jgi:hypothetical protein
MPDVESLAEAEIDIFETNHPFLPVEPFMFTLMDGLVVSTDIVVDELAVLPALSAALTETWCTPSFNVADDCHAPLSTDTNAPAKPEVESEPVGVIVTWDLYQPFDPFEPLMSKPTFGESGS